MTKEAFVKTLATKSGEQQAAVKRIWTAFEELTKELLTSGEKLILPGFTSISSYTRKSTTGVNPQTKERITIPSRRVAKWKWSKKISDKLNGK